MTRRRIVLAGLFHETHTFLDGLTPLEAFARREGRDLLAAGGDGSPLDGFLEVAERHDWQVIPSIDMRATPSATVQDEVLDAFWYEHERKLTHALQQGPIDGVFFVLHGAMVTESYPDVETEILRRNAAHWGPNRPPVFGVVDLHANLGPDTARYADGLVAYQKNPHTDARRAAMRASELLAHCLTTGVRPALHIHHAPVMWPPTGTGTDDLPMRQLERRAREIEQHHDDLWSVNVLAGFAYADTPHTGVAFFTVGTNADAAATCLEDLTREAWALRHEGCVAEEDPDALLGRILPVRQGPVVLSEPSDNVGGGAPGDGTGALRVLLKRDLRSALIVMNDPLAIDSLHHVPIGSTIELPIGGRGSRFDEGPVTLNITLKSRSHGRFDLEDRHSHLASMLGTRVDMGPCAVVQHRAVTLLLTTHKTPPFDLGQLHSQGLDPTTFEIVVVKAAVAHRRAYDPIAAASYSLATPGPCPGDLTQLPYKRISRPIFPLDQDVTP